MTGGSLSILSSMSDILEDFLRQLWNDDRFVLTEGTRWRRIGSWETRLSTSDALIGFSGVQPAAAARALAPVGAIFRDHIPAWHPCTHCRASIMSLTLHVLTPKLPLSVWLILKFHIVGTMTDIKAKDHRAYMEYALGQARKSPPRSTNYAVGAVLVDASTNTILADGYTLELEGNTHAEQCCLMKLSKKYGVPEEALGDVLPPNLVLYTTVEPCSKRLSGNLPCAERILRLAGVIKTVYVGVLEPQKFVQENTGRAALEEAGMQFVHVGGMEDEILAVAKAGHTS